MLMVCGQGEMYACCTRGERLEGRDPTIGPRGDIERLCLPAVDPSTLTSDWFTSDQKRSEADLGGRKGLFLPYSSGYLGQKQIR